MSSIGDRYKAQSGHDHLATGIDEAALERELTERLREATIQELNQRLVGQPRGVSRRVLKAEYERRGFPAIARMLD